MKSLKSHLNIGRYNFVEWCLNWISRTEIEMQKGEILGKIVLGKLVDVYPSLF